MVTEIRRQAMFKPLRRKIVVQVTMWLLIITFVIWGAGSVVMGTKNYAGVIFGRKVSPQEYNRIYSAIYGRARIQYGDNLSKLEKFLNLREQAWDRLILKYDAKRKFIGASNKEVIEKITSLPFFQRNGVFDNGLYNYIVENIFQVKPREFEESIRDDILIAKLIDSVTKNVKLTDDEILRSYRDANELADMSFLLIKTQDYTQNVEVKDEELLPYYEANKKNFLSPVMVNVAYIKIPFNDKKDEARFLAEEMIGSIKKGGTLEAAAREYKIGLKETGLFSMADKIPGIGLSYSFALAAFSLKEKQTSDPIEAEDSFYIMKLKSKKPPSTLPFEEARPRVKDALVMEKESVLAETAAKDILSKINKEAKTLEDVAKELNYVVLTSKEISRTKNKYVEGVGPSDSLVNTAFSLKVGQVGGPVKTPMGHAILRLDSIKPFDEERFKAEKGLFAASLMEERKMGYFQKWFLNLKNKAGLRDNLSG